MTDRNKPRFNTKKKGRRISKVIHNSRTYIGYSCLKSLGKSLSFTDCQLGLKCSYFPVENKLIQDTREARIPQMDSKASLVINVKI